MKRIYKNIIRYSYVFMLVFFFLIFAKKQDITGTIRMVGTSIFPEIVITTEERDYYLLSIFYSFSLLFLFYPHNSISVK